MRQCSAAEIASQEPKPHEIQAMFLSHVVLLCYCVGPLLPARFLVDPRAWLWLWGWWTSGDVHHVPYKKLTLWGSQISDMIDPFKEVPNHPFESDFPLTIHFFLGYPHDNGNSHLLQSSLQLISWSAALKWSCEAAEIWGRPRPNGFWSMEVFTLLILDGYKIFVYCVLLQMGINELWSSIHLDTLCFFATNGNKRDKYWPIWLFLARHGMHRPLIHQRSWGYQPKHWGCTLW